MKLDELQRHWNDFGKQDPLWAIMTWPSKRNRQWKLDEFFRTGEDEIKATLDHVESVGLPRPHRRALDFGCGVGRLTQALGTRFESVCGVDIAQSMIELAREYNKHGERCQYFHNTADDLRIFEDGSFDFVFTLRVLQHMRPEYSQAYIREFMRLLAPGAVAVFQIPGPAPAPAPAEPLPDAAFRAEIRVEQDAATATAGAVVPLTVRVRNVSAAPWPSRALSTSVHPLRLGSHWRASGAPERDDARVVLERDLAPGEETAVSLAVTAPAKQGDYILALDLVQEGIGWFADRASRAASVRVRVVGEPWTQRVRQRLGALRARPEPRMEMYATPRELVAATVESAGGRVVDVQADLTVEGWSSATYYVQKGPRQGREAGAADQ
jgi:ubiquinone/menaquinone biosynthesis C-methylase UbiE